MRLPRTLLARIVLVVIVAALCGAGYHLVHLLILEARGGFDGIAYIFLTMARGILNGLRPYADLYDSKPPGMYLVTILSLLLTGHLTFGVVLQILLFALLPLMLAAFAWMQTRGNTDVATRFIVTALGFLFGCLLFFYLEDRVRGYMAESFGATIGCIYLLHIVLRKDASRPSAIALNALLLSGTFGFKEPFLFSMTAGALLVARDLKQFRNAFLYPLGVSVLAGAALLAMLGWLGPYLSYVLEMTGGRILHGRHEALWMRGLTFARLFGNMTIAYSAPLFGVLAGSLVLFAPAATQHLTDRRAILRSVATTAAACALLIALSLVLIRQPDYPLLLPVRWGSLAGPELLIVAGIVIAALLWSLWKLRVSARTVFTCVALMLTSIAVGTSEYVPSHYGFSIPFFFALSLLWIRDAARGQLTRLPVVIVGALIVLTSLFFRSGAGHLAQLRQSIGVASLADPMFAARFDDMMRSCGYTDYFNDDVRVKLSLSRLSPIGPLFSIGEHSWYLAPDAPLITRTIRNIEERAQVLVMLEGGRWKMNNAEWGAQWGNVLTFFPQLQPLFTTDAPPCAKPYLPLEGVTVYFRSSSGLPNAVELP